MSEKALSAYEIQKKAESTSDVDELRSLHAIVLRGDVKNAEHRATLDLFIKGKIRKINSRGGE